MFDVAHGNAGAQILLASSSDDKHPPENVIDGNPETFWTTTGMFPQEFIVKFSSVMNMTRLSFSSFNVKKMVIETTESESPEKFEVILEKELESTDHQLQNEEFPMNNKRAQCMRVVIESGYDHFVSVHKLHVEGSALHG
ncbi:intraflagellar transport protein 25 homolog [Haliotis asinina]|uniref:intraflagellar transport protein 25 homolog n=1 Tax=Haliotis asinina TaxID=109174 RepID=UPI003531E6CA